MGKSKDLTEAQRSAVKTLLQHTTLSIREVASRTGVSKSSASSLKKDLHEGQTSQTQREKRGRKRITTDRDDAIIRRSTRKSPWIKASHMSKSLYKEGIDTSEWTVCRRLHESGFKSVRPKRKPVLTPAMKKKRLEWARNHQDWGVKL